MGIPGNSIFLTVTFDREASAVPNRGSIDAVLDLFYPGFCTDGWSWEQPQQPQSMVGAIHELPLP